MKQRLRIIIPVVLILALVGYLLWRAFGHRETGPPSSITGNGVIEATEVDLTSKVSGKILTLTVHEGDPVAAGELIATLESAELLGQVEQSLGNLHAAEANYAELKNGSRAEDIRKAREQYNAAVEA
ncbi:MAG TPA: biotin/lipoyl-binding protein, partial [Armatimonadota bacterium]